MIAWYWVLIALFVGGWVGIVLTSILAMSARVEEEEQIIRLKSEDNMKLILIACSIVLTLAINGSYSEACGSGDVQRTYRGEMANDYSNTYMGHRESGLSDTHRNETRDHEQMHTDTDYRLQYYSGS